MIDQAGGGVAVFVKNCLKVIEVKSEFVTFDCFKFIWFNLIINVLKLRFICIYIPPNLSKSIKIVSNMIDLIKHFTPKNFSFYILADFNFPNNNWSIPSSSFNGRNKSFIKFVPKIF